MKESFEDKMSGKFRKELENYQVPYDQHAWERLSKDLQSKPVSPWRKWKLLAGWGFGIVVAGLMLYQTYLSTFEPLDIKQQPQNSTSTIAEKENVQSGSPTAGNSIDFSNKIQGGSETSVPNVTIKERSMTQKFSVPEKENEPINNETEELTNEVSGLKTSELMLAKEDLIKEQEMELTLKKLPSRNIIFSETKKERLKFQLPKLNLDFSGDHYSHFVGSNKVSLYYNPEFDLERTLKNPGLVHGLGIELEGPINSKINLAVGINYFSKKYSGSEAFRLDSFAVKNPRIPFVDSTITRTGNYQFIEMPVILRVNLYSGQRSSLFFDGGFSVIAFLNQEYNTHTVVNLVETDVNIKQKAWKNIYPVGSLNLGLTYRYALSDRFSFSTSVEYKNHLSGLGALPMKLDRFSGKIGIMYRFGRKDDN